MQNQTPNSQTLTPQEQLRLLEDALSYYSRPNWTPETPVRPALGGYDSGPLQ